MFSSIDWEVVFCISVVCFFDGVGKKVANDTLLSPVAIKELQTLVQCRGYYPIFMDPRPP
jgi:hypothetical protein